MNKSASYFLEIPRRHPFDQEATRWPTFVGEFVMSATRGHAALFWFTYYGDAARFRIYGEEGELASIHAQIDELICQLGLAYRVTEKGKREEQDYTLEGDLGGGRFLGAERTDVSATARGVKVLRMLHAG